MTAILLTQTQHGTLQLDQEGSFKYTANKDYFGSDSFSYQSSDGKLSSNIVSVTILVNDTNLKPVAVDDSYTIATNTALQVSVANGLQANDSDPDGDLLKVIIATQPQHGTLHALPDGSFIYQPAPDYSGDDSFTYLVNDGNKDSNEATVSINVHAINHAPVLSPSTHIVSPNTVLQVGTNKGVLINAVDKDKNLIYAILATGATHGSVQLLPGGGFIYTPNLGYTGPDSFIVKGTDGNKHSVQAVITLDVTLNLIPPATPAKPIPTLSQWAVILLSMLMLVAAGRFGRRVE